MADNKEIKLPEASSYSQLPEYKDHVDRILEGYDSPEGFLGELVRQMADAMWWVKTYQKDKDHVILMKMASTINRDHYRIDTEKDALRIFNALFASWSGQKLKREEQQFLSEAMTRKGYNLTSLRAEAIGRLIKELDVIDRLIERQVKNMRLLMQSYESVRFAPQLLKKMSLEIQQLEHSIESQRQEVSRQ
jgi:HAMP domain-containing protein